MFTSTTPICAQVAGSNPDWQQLDLLDAPLPPEILHSPNSSHVTIAVYADDKRRCQGKESGWSARGAAPGEAGASDEHALCGGRCCGAGDSGGTKEEVSFAPQDQGPESDASAPQGRRDTGEGASAGEGIQLQSSGDGLHLDSRQNSLAAGAEPGFSHAERVLCPMDGQMDAFRLLLCAVSSDWRTVLAQARRLWQAGNDERGCLAGTVAQ